MNIARLHEILEDALSYYTSQLAVVNPYDTELTLFYSGSIVSLKKLADSIKKEVSEKKTQEFDDGYRADAFFKLETIWNALKESERIENLRKESSNIDPFDGFTIHIEKRGADYFAYFVELSTVSAFGETHIGTLFALKRGWERMKDRCRVYSEEIPKPRKKELNEHLAALVAFAITILNNERIEIDSLTRQQIDEATKWASEIME